MSVTRKEVIALILLCAIGFFVLPAMSAVPSQINFQGRLIDNNVKPVPDGTYSMRFFLFSALTGGCPSQKLNQMIF